MKCNADLNTSLTPLRNHSISLLNNELASSTSKSKMMTAPNATSADRFDLTLFNSLCWSFPSMIFHSQLYKQNHLRTAHARNIELLTLITIICSCTQHSCNQQICITIVTDRNRDQHDHVSRITKLCWFPYTVPTYKQVKKLSSEAPIARKCWTSSEAQIARSG